MTSSPDHSKLTRASTLPHQCTNCSISAILDFFSVSHIWREGGVVCGGMGDEHRAGCGAVGMGQRRHVQGPAHSNHGESSGVRMVLYLYYASADGSGEFESTPRVDIVSCRACHSYFPVLFPRSPPRACLFPSQGLPVALASTTFPSCHIQLSRRCWWKSSSGSSGVMALLPDKLTGSRPSNQTEQNPLHE
jgi:hypothetical protein